MVVACDFFKPTDDREPVARVGENYLYHEDIEDLVVESISPEDSAQIVSSYINRWATQQLLLDGAELNLSEDKQADFDRLVQQYKNDLYTKAYLDALVKKSIDTTVSESEALEVYEANQESFKLNEELVKFRYITIPQNAINEAEITERFKRFDIEDQRYLDSIAVQFKSYTLNDSIWIQASLITEKISVLNSENKKELLKKSNYVQLKDSIDLYLMQIKDVLFRNDLAPLEYVKPTIKQIVINQRKLELIKQLEKDITKDAIKNKQFEIYN
ncbi:MAG: peptidyl-prolyl cis-trans isomerase [Psychroserpens sp.]|nr:peptidyl-prolyl cis-trans isomerase [Psychroserpens sp.]MBO6631982.1 peptidyl-prolyl cis-trans isomerase [Psychroserpens sp.]MBO6654373.1 peptidyl-prolyl cis-trans isomerase [Psychroserpens sp.]MBO6682341.1 peptidyl-prolyl cis-trans isomerase [Psychroserpens sp.]MBO6750999.1 peptidyl-prolyl cis-trans isomerase [Psychroserpens sp.]